MANTVTVATGCYMGKSTSNLLDTVSLTQLGAVQKYLRVMCETNGYKYRWHNWVLCRETYA